LKPEKLAEITIYSPKPSKKKKWNETTAVWGGEVSGEVSPPHTRCGFFFYLKGSPCKTRRTPIKFEVYNKGSVKAALMIAIKALVVTAIKAL
jgi:hypothetical protein